MDYARSCSYSHFAGLPCHLIVPLVIEASSISLFDKFGNLSYYSLFKHFIDYKI